jgi:hypothetical protein
VEDDVSVYGEMFLVTGFVNLKINPAQPFGRAHRDMMYVHVSIEINNHTCINICVCSVFLSKELYDQAHTYIVVEPGAS